MSRVAYDAPSPVQYGSSSQTIKMQWKSSWPLETAILAIDAYATALAFRRNPWLTGIGFGLERIWFTPNIQMIKLASDDLLVNEARRRAKLVDTLMWRTLRLGCLLGEDRLLGECCPINPLGLIVKPVFWYLALTAGLKFSKDWRNSFVLARPVEFIQVETKKQIPEPPVPTTNITVKATTKLIDVRFDLDEIDAEAETDDTVVAAKPEDAADVVKAPTGVETDAVIKPVAEDVAPAVKTVETDKVVKPVAENKPAPKTEETPAGKVDAKSEEEMQADELEQLLMTFLDGLHNK